MQLYGQHYKPRFLTLFMTYLLKFKRPDHKRTIVSFVYSFLVSDWSLKTNQKSGDGKQNLRLFFKDRPYISVCILFTNSYKRKNTCIRTYKYNTEKYLVKPTVFKNPASHLHLKSSFM